MSQTQLPLYDDMPDPTGSGDVAPKGATDVASAGESLISAARSAFHAGLLESNVLSINEAGVPSNADKDSKSSIQFAAHIAKCLELETIQERAKGQTLGGKFEEATRKFLEATFPHLQSVRPGQWELTKVGNGNKRRKGPGPLAKFEQYHHLAKLDKAAADDLVLRSVLGNAYAISPDIVISRAPVSDEAINRDQFLVDGDTGTRSPLRADYSDLPILHAVVSCKWTMRTDRSQNSRSEALNLIRNRKGRLPHIAVVTAEPMPSRLASLALGTGDMDCVYHAMLPELMEAVEKHGNDDSHEMMKIMVQGNRLKDISDLPLDLAV